MTDFKDLLIKNLGRDDFDIQHAGTLMVAISIGYLAQEVGRFADEFKSAANLLHERLELAEHLRRNRG
jgi:hypothetical protein